MHGGLEPEAVRERLLLQLGQDHAGPAPSRTDFRVMERIPDRDIARREASVAVGVLGEGQPDLLQVVLTGGPPRLLPGGLNRRQEQRDQRPDDRDDHQQLDQGEAGRTTWLSIHPRASKRPVHVINPWSDAQLRTAVLIEPIDRVARPVAREGTRLQATHGSLILDVTPCMESKQADISRVTRRADDRDGLLTDASGSEKRWDFAARIDGSWSIRAAEIPRVCNRRTLTDA